MRLVWRWVPGFTWVQIIITPSLRFGHWWAVRRLVRTHAFGPLRVLTMRTFKP